jgi:hypothetical protein
MKNKWCYSRLARATSLKFGTVLAAVTLVLAGAPAAVAGDAPQWMHGLVNAPLPTHDEKADAVLMYSDTNVNVQSVDKIKTTVRGAYKILRPDGREHGLVVIPFNSYQKVTSIHGWCIPAEGKDYEVKDKDAVERSLPKVENGNLIDDTKAKLLMIPAADVGNIIGYEYVVEERPLVLQDVWQFQGMQPVKESHYSLQLPQGWEYKATWLNYPEAKPAGGAGQWQWSVGDVKGIREEENMPPWRGVAGHMVVSFYPPGGAGTHGFSNWQEMGNWQRSLSTGRVDASPDIKQKVAALTANANTPVAKMQALAQFVQHDIRYVAIELGIGGWQPHPASEIFTHRYGDCKDKTTLMASMLHEIGVEYYYVVINAARGSVTADTPANLAFNHMIIALKLPESVQDPSLVATMQEPKLGKILFFDPTDELTPFGRINGALQANYGLLVTPDGGELVELPKQPSSMNSIRRVAKLTLDASGTLQGNVEETRVGDRAWSQRWALRNVTSNTERIKPIENILAASIPNFRITKASVLNPTQNDQPFGFVYTFEAESYAKTAGNLLLVRTRVLGSKSDGILETREPRQFPIEFDGPARDTDSFEITLPAGYEVDELPPPTDADFSFASYHSKTELKGNVINYSRSFEIKELSVPVKQSEELRKFYRMIASDERNTAVLRPVK